MELRYLASFLAIAEELHFGRAAARLHLAQPSISQQLQRLEREVGVELVSRSSHEVRLTPAGRTFEVEARKLLEATRRAVTVAREAAAGRMGSINIGFNYPAGQRVLQPTLVRLASGYPGVSTSLWEARSGPQLAALADARLDVALVFAGPPTAQQRSRKVLTVPLVAVVSKRHPWANRHEVPFRELAEQPCVLFHREESPAMHDALVAAAYQCGISLSVTEEIADAGAAGIVITTRQVVGFASAERAAHLPGSELTSVRLVDPVPTVALHAVWRPDPQPVVGAFLDCLKAAGPFSAAGPLPVSRLAPLAPATADGAKRG